MQRKGAGSKTFLALTKLGLEPELLAIITCQNVLNLLMLPCFRNKDEMQENARHNRFGEVPFATAATRVGEALRLSRELLVGPCLPGCARVARPTAVVDCFHILLRGRMLSVVLLLLRTARTRRVS